MIYRRDINGLRAIAVLGVLAYHFKMGIPGGFAGVDVFFVISGYLISKNIYAQVLSGHWSFLEFYSRRARRIVPAMVFNLALVAIAATMMLYPSELVDFGKSAAAAVLSAPNIYFYATSDYFSQPAETIPLLHLWSLGVEEQFYLLFPPLALFLLRHRVPVLIGALCALLVVSLIASQYMVQTEPVGAFYLLPFRAFELLIGCVLAVPSFRGPCSGTESNIASIIGLVLIAASYGLLTSTMPFPGLRALMPCLGAAALLWAGRRPDAMGNRLLSFRLAEWFGLISYSLYLSHWPVAVFTRRGLPDMAAAQLTFLQFSVSVGVAAISYYLIEKPLRNGCSTLPPIRVLAIAGIPLFAALLLVSWTIQQNGFGDSIDERTKNTLAYLYYDARPLFRSDECFLNAEQKLSDVDAGKCLPSGRGTPAILWGDSHAADLFKGLNQPLLHRGYDLGVLTASGCAPAMNRNATTRPLCKKFNDDVMALVLALRPNLVILASTWGRDPSILDGVKQTVEMLSKAGIQVRILGDRPLYKRSVPLILADRIRSGNTNVISDPGDLEVEFNKASDAMMESGFQNSTSAKFISQYQVVCPADKCSMALIDGTPVQFDIAHYTEMGARYVAREIAPLLIK